MFLPSAIHIKDEVIKKKKKKKEEKIYKQCSQYYKTASNTIWLILQILHNSLSLVTTTELFLYLIYRQKQTSLICSILNQFSCHFPASPWSYG